jgi:uncharacterized Ntn-hydrolase superfamily protein
LTFSIVARDEKTGEMGVAVQSHWFSVGSAVTWARAGVGAVATQAMADTRYGPLGLELMSAGKIAPEALGSLLESDKKRDVRQVAMIDSKGNVAAHTGPDCIPFAGHAIGKGFSCQANIMRSKRVWTGMKRSFEENSNLSLAERLVGSLEAGEEAGGDLRGKQSAAILVVGKELKPTYWDGRRVDLRVEDSPEPLPELRRLLRYQRGYEWVNMGDDFLSSEKYRDALNAYRKGLEIVPEVLELKYWVGMSMLKTRERSKGLAILKEVFQEDRSWVKLTRMMAKKNSMGLGASELRELSI